MKEVNEELKEQITHIFWEIYYCGCRAEAKRPNMGGLK